MQEQPGKAIGRLPSIVRCPARQGKGFCFERTKTVWPADLPFFHFRPEKALEEKWVQLKDRREGRRRKDIMERKETRKERKERHTIQLALGSHENPDQPFYNLRDSR